MQTKQPTRVLLDSINLRYFKGAVSVDFLPKCHDMMVFGDNGTGKSTLADAFSWCLFGKDSLGRSDFEIKTIYQAGRKYGTEFKTVTQKEADLRYIPGLDHSVEIVIYIDGSKLSLMRVYKEKYEKKRGSATSEFSGHTTDYFINTVPVSKGEFDQRVASICSYEIFQLLTNVEFFNKRLSWQDRRKILLDICGDITDAQVIAAFEALKDLPAILGDHSLDNYRKIITTRRTAINDELKQIPARIDEANRALPVVDLEVDHSALVEARQQRLDGMLQKKAGMNAGGIIAELTRKKDEIESEMIQIANRIRSAGNPERDAMMQKMRERDAEVSRLRSHIQSLERRIADGKFDLEQLDKKIEATRAEWKAASDKVFTGETSCPSCGQDLPEDKVQTAVEAFNEARAKKLADIKEVGLSYKESKAKRSEALTTLESELETAKSALEITLKVEFEIPAEETADPTQDKDYQTKASAKSEVLRQIENERLGSSSALASLNSEITDIQSLLEAAKAEVSKIGLCTDGEKRIGELKTKEKELAKEYEKLEGELFLTDEFVKAKVSMLTDRINSKFEFTRFQLFETQVNGGIAPCCISTYKGVPYDGGLNHGACINVGLDIIKTCQAHYGFHPVVIIDGCESVSHPIDMDCQVIKLVVSEPDKILRFESLETEQSALL